MKYITIAISILLAVSVSGCSATSLRCGTDGDVSYVELINVPQDLTSQTRHFRDLCGFNYDKGESNGG